MTDFETLIRLLARAQVEFILARGATYALSLYRISFNPYRLRYNPK